eukprot:NODE_2426_length_788_cov_944.763194_g1689_i0.p1 GENE.NODE_2426_length_788_cov_944.763194_g1689_i0~~NODE_2426_length_788_cov_944.763194_g1689_i0.p1  ORF type:complete len:169 (+),score=69.47 NODE_2426_length_788_cov_944.763194_g1689_i0:79-585(+)
MYIYKDVFCGDEVLTDTYPMKELDDAVYEVEAKYVTISTENDFDIGANASAEEAEEGLESNSQQVINLVHFQRLVDTSFDKKGYMAAIKAYMKKVKEHLEAKKPERVAAFQAGAQTFVKKVLAEFDEYTFYMGESMDPESGIILCRFGEDGMTQKFYFFKDGLAEEKV